MYTQIIKWKSFKIHLPELNNFLLSYSPNYVGCSANGNLELHFREEPSDQIKAYIQMHMDTLNENGENLKISLAIRQNNAILVAKTAMLTSDISSWIPAERKIFMNLELNNDDRHAILTKYNN